MRITNGTNDPVEWEQNGSGGSGLATESQSGELTGLQGTGPIQPVGSPPWAVTFTNLNKPSQTVDSPKFSDPEATVTLNADWTVTVSGSAGGGDR